VRHSRGEVLFGWILDGYALQDIFLGYPKPGSNEERRMVTGVRFVDPKTDKWTVMFAAPSFAAAVRMEGGAEGDRIVLRGHDDHGAELRWSFNDLTPNSFVWRGETSHDGGKTWRISHDAAPRPLDSAALLLLAFQNPHDCDDRVPIAGRRRHTEQSVEPAKIADRPHVTTVHSEDEALVGRDDSHEPLPARRKLDRKGSADAAGLRQDTDEANSIRA